MKDIIHKTFDVTAESDEMIVGGFITTGNQDRHGDIVDAKGVDVSQLQVLLEGHDHTKPVGRLIDTEERNGGVYARFKVLADDTWQKVKSGLYPAFSIGFIPKTAEPMKEGGWLYKAIEVIETSLVAIPSNRESQILEVRNAPTGNNPAQEATMTEAKTVKKVGPAVHTANHEYSLQRAMASIINHREPRGLEGETSQELMLKSPWREYDGCAVPLEQVFLTKKQRAEVTKASAVVGPGNLAPLTGEDYRDELFTLIDAAISRQMLMGRAGGRVISGLTEQDIKIPRQDGQMSAGFVAMDTDLPTSADPSFSTTSMFPRLCGAISELKMSSILAQHPRVGTDFIGSEMRRALIQSLEDAYINGDNTGTPAEPDGLVNLADDTDALAAGTATAVSDLLAALTTFETYIQQTDQNLTWILDQGFLDSMVTSPAWVGNTGSSASQALRDQGQALISALNLPGTTTKTGFFGDFSTHVTGIWEGIDLALNPYADSVFASKSTLLRVSMLMDYQVCDAKRIRQIATTVA